MTLHRGGDAKGRGGAFPQPQAGCMVFINTRRYKVHSLIRVKLFLFRLVFKKTYNLPYGRGKYTPFGACGTTFPPMGALSYGPILCIYIPLDDRLHQYKMVFPKQEV